MSVCTAQASYHNKISDLSFWRLESLRSRWPLFASLLRTLLGLQVAVFSLCPYMVKREEIMSMVSLLIGILIPSWGPHLYDHIQP